MRRLFLGVVVVVTVAALVALGWGQLQLRDERSGDAASSAAAKASSKAVTSVLSYDYRTLQAGFDTTLPLLTGDAKKQYDDLQQPLLSTAPDLQAVVRSEVKTVSVLDSDSDSARVLLFVDQTSTSTKLTQPQLDQSRILVTLVRKNDRWLVDSLSAV